MTAVTHLTPPASRPDDAPRPAGVADLAELAVVERSGFRESCHFGVLSVVGRDGAPAFELGIPAAAFLPRSTVKPFQAIAALRAGVPLRDASLAVAAASHGGSPEQVAAVLEILAPAGLGEDDLQCPAALPRDPDARVAAQCAGAQPRRLWYNCSGKHAAMLAACVASSWETATYLDPDHPLQRLIRATLEEFAGPVSHVAVDGCGAPLFSVTLRGLARAYHRLVTAEPGSDARRVADAMRAFPHLVAGTGQPDTELMRLMPGALAKGGAEGVLVVAAPTGEAVAVKVADGSDRPAMLVALAALARIGVDVSAATALRQAPVLGGSRVVGQVVPAFTASSQREP